MAGFRYALPAHELRSWSVAASDQSAVFPASNLALPEFWTLPYLSRSADPPILTFDFGTPVTPAGLFLNDVNFSTCAISDSTDGVAFVLRSTHAMLIDPRVDRGKCLLDATLPISKRWVQLRPSGLNAGEWSFRIGGLLWVSTLLTFADPPRPPLTWERVQDGDIVARRGASPQVTELGVAFLRYNDFGSDVNRRLVGGSLAQWQALLNVGQMRPFLFVEPFGNQYSYYLRRASPAPVAERFATYGSSMTMEEAT